MKIQCQKSQLVEAVSNVQRAVSSKSTLAALEGILLKTTTNGDLKLCGYDLELGITTVIEAQVDEPGEVVLSARLFGDIVRRLPDETVTILVDEKMITQITCGPSEFSIVGIPSSEYPELPSVEGASSIDLTSPILKSMIRQTLFAVADTDAKPVHTVLDAGFKARRQGFHDGIGIPHFAVDFSAAGIFADASVHHFSKTKA